MKTAVGVVVSWFVLLGVIPAARQAPAAQIPTFKTGVDVVQLDVSVLDKARRPVRGLTAADFTVLEDGKPRPLVSFSAIELPPLPAAVPAGAETVPPDVIRNDLPEGRIVVILIDPFLERVMVPGRVTIADPPGLSALRATALRVLQSLGPGDVAAVAHTMHGIAQNLTTDRTRLERAINSTAYGTSKRADGENTGDCNCGTCRVEAITRIAAALRNEPHRRKAVFFVGERVPLAPVEGQCNTYLEPATRRMVTATQLANVTVHTVDPNSLETTNVHAGDDFKPAGVPISVAAAAQEKANRAFLIERQQSLQSVADWTGGRAVLNTNVPEASVRPILDESSAYYLLAFQTSDVKADGRFHPITVKVNRPDVQVRTRKGYYADAAASAPGAPVSLDAVSRGLLPERGLPMSIAAAAFRGPGGTPIVVVSTGIRAADVSAANTPPGGQTGQDQTEAIEILSSAFSESGKDVEWQRQRLSVALPEQAPGQLRYESVSTLTLQPGRYELRVAARHEKEGVVGSVHTYADVPDFASSPLTLSGIVLLDPRSPVATPPEALAGLLDTAPTTRRDFGVADEVAALVRVYQTQPEPVTVTFRVLDEGLRDVSEAKVALPPGAFSAGAPADARYALPFQKLKPGTYVLRVAAARGGSTSGAKDVRFTVR